MSYIYNQCQIVINQATYKEGIEINEVKNKEHTLAQLFKSNHHRNPQAHHNAIGLSQTLIPQLIAHYRDELLYQYILKLTIKIQNHADKILSTNSNVSLLGLHLQNQIATLEYAATYIQNFPELYVLKQMLCDYFRISFLTPPFIVSTQMIDLFNLNLIRDIYLTQFNYTHQVQLQNYGHQYNNNTNKFDFTLYDDEPNINQYQQPSQLAPVYSQYSTSNTYNPYATNAQVTDSQFQYQQSQVNSQSSYNYQNQYNASTYQQPAQQQNYSNVYNINNTYVNQQPQGYNNSNQQQQNYPPQQQQNYPPQQQSNYPPQQQQNYAPLQQQQNYPPTQQQQNYTQNQQSNYPPQQQQQQNYTSQYAPQNYQNNNQYNTYNNNTQQNQYQQYQQPQNQYQQNQPQSVNSPPLQTDSFIASKNAQQYQQNPIQNYPPQQPYESSSMILQQNTTQQQQQLVAKPLNETQIQQPLTNLSQSTYISQDKQIQQPTDAFPQNTTSENIQNQNQACVPPPPPPPPPTQQLVQEQQSNQIQQPIEQKQVEQPTEVKNDDKSLFEALILNSIIQNQQLTNGKGDVLLKTKQVVRKDRSIKGFMNHDEFSLYILKNYFDGKYAQNKIDRTEEMKKLTNF